MFCCDDIPAKYAPIESGMPPGLRRNGQQNIAALPEDRLLVKTAGNALFEVPPESSSPQQVSGKNVNYFAQR